jgi:hypothetical protein
MSVRVWPAYVICDLDGCISDDRWRRHLLPSPPDGHAPEKYDEYHSLAFRDQCVADVVSDVMYDIHDTYDHTGHQKALLLVVTARPDRHNFRRETMDWLNSVFPGVAYELLMRPSNSCESSRTLKRTTVEQYFMSVSDQNHWQRVVSAYDDRQDVLDSYPVEDFVKQLRILPDVSVDTFIHAHKSVAEILRSMAATSEERAKIYGDHYRHFAPVVKALWPNGVPSALVTEDRWHLFELLLVKVVRFAATGLTHRDSIHDLAVYAAMIESDLSGKA